jgi:O-6-methylguanine DNA methyltransferase
MGDSGYALFDTPIGPCGVVWGSSGITAIALPEATKRETRARLKARAPGVRELPPPPAVQRVLHGILALLRGERVDLSEAPLDMNGVAPFFRRVYEAARGIPPGTTLSYGQLAARLGSPGSARAVGQALGRNPFPIVVPCHRILAAGGRPGGFTASGGVDTKLRLLSLERTAPASSSAAAILEGAPGTATVNPFGFDPVIAVEALRASDRVLGRLVDQVGPFVMQLKQTPSLFFALAEAIIHQQLTGKAAATIHARFCAAFSGGIPDARHILRASDETLRSIGLSGSKQRSLRDLAERVDAGTLPTFAELARMENDAIIERLTQVRGIGRWTVEMVLMFRLGRPDVLPLDDYGIRKGFAVAFRRRELPDKRALEQRGARWRPYRTVASWYLWRAAELPGARAARTAITESRPRRPRG